MPVKMAQPRVGQCSEPNRTPFLSGPIAMMMAVPAKTTSAVSAMALE